MAQERISSALLYPHPSDTSTVSLSGGRIAPAPPEEKSTTLAILLSAALPGAGQVYTERYLTIPVIWGFGYYFGNEVVKQNDRYKDYRGRYESSVRADTVNGTGDLQLKNIRDFYRDQRDEFAVYLALTYLLNIVDAYVGAALYGFDVSPNLGGGAEVRLTLPIARPPAPHERR